MGGWATISHRNSWLAATHPFCCSINVASLCPDASLDCKAPPILSPGTIRSLPIVPSLTWVGILKSNCTAARALSTCSNAQTKEPISYARGRVLCFSLSLFPSHLSNLCLPSAIFCSLRLLLQTRCVEYLLMVVYTESEY